MDNIINRENAYAEYMEVKRGLRKKVGILGLCALAFFIMFRLANKDIIMKTTPTITSRSRKTSRSCTGR